MQEKVTTSVGSVGDAAPSDQHKATAFWRAAFSRAHMPRVFQALRPL